MHFALSHHRLLVVMIIFDRILNGDHVNIIALDVHDIQQRGQSRTFTRTCRPRDQDETTRFVEQFLHAGRDPNLLHGQQRAGDLAQYHGKIAPLLEDTDTKTRRIPKSESKVRPTVFPYLLDVIFRRNTPHQVFGVIRGQGRPFDLVQSTMNANGRGNPRTDVQIGGTLGYHQLQQI